jgi:hypothetical protein
MMNKGDVPSDRSAARSARSDEFPVEPRDRVGRGRRRGVCRGCHDGHRGRGRGSMGPKIGGRTSPILPWAAQRSRAAAGSSPDARQARGPGLAGIGRRRVLGTDGVQR